MYCPQCKPHIFEIAEGLDNWTDTNAALPMATEGHLTTCGARLIADSAGPGFLSDAMQFLQGKGFNDRYVLRDNEGQAMSNTYYAVNTGKDYIEYGTTDHDGHTHLCLTGDDEQELTFYLAG